MRTQQSASTTYRREARWPSTDETMAHSDIAQDFGANDWLIDEMRERFQADPSQLDPAWVEYFRTETPGVNSTSPSAAVATAPAKTDAPTRPSTTGTSATGATTPATHRPQPAKPAGDQSGAAAPQAVRPEAKTKPAPAAPSNRSPERQPSASGPSDPGSLSGLSADMQRSTRGKAQAAAPVRTKLRGPAMRTAKNMEASLAMPTATSVRTVPMKLVIEQRTIINNFLRRSRGGKVSFTHIIGYAMVQALKALPEMNNGYDEPDGHPTLIENPSINLGIAVDVTKADGTRQLLVPNIKGCEDLDFAEFREAYEDVIKRAREGRLTVDDFAGTTASLTNPGGIGTTHSVPRLMTGQGVILGVGSIAYAPEFEGASLHRLNELGVGKITTLTSTYDHRVIQGAVSGEFLKTIHDLLLGEHDFFTDIFTSLRIPYAPLLWHSDIGAFRTSQVPKAARVLELVMAYRNFGHMIADTDPLEYRQRRSPDLQLETHGLTLWDLDREFPIGTFAESERAVMKLRDILEVLRDSYCHTLGVEYMHIQDTQQRLWFQSRFERSHQPFPREEHIRILDKLNEAEVFETFLQTKFVGQKRFSLEGGESAIVLLDEICERAADAGLDEVVIGMPHRGRLNVLANIVGKKYGQIFREFEGNIDPRTNTGSGDVKYHLGAEGEFHATSGTVIKTSVAANPSHLEAVDPVLEGIVRAKQDRLEGDDPFAVLPLLMHGDAAFAGQGVVYEVLQMSQLRGYRTGGTVHLVVNNQVGFTTAPLEARTSAYCTDVAKTIQAPVLHVNGDDPEACVRAARIAFEFRETFHKDVVIDLVCYRRRGHNEGDDPSFTQPHMYDLIEQKRSTRRIYTEALIGRGDITTQDADAAMSRFRKRLEELFTLARGAEDPADDDTYARTAYYPNKPSVEGGTSISQEMLQRMAHAYSHFPEHLTVHPKVARQVERRAHQILEGPIDWATAELLAFGSLLMEGRPVRLAGQDTRRGTFSQRFAAIVDRVTNEEYVPFKHLTDSQATFDVYDSLLNEYAALGFEYGYSVAAPEALVLWEAQFGDFANVAQAVADEFISSGYAKWQQKSGVVMLLPHGYEGQGPDHSSARIERWLQLCSEGALAVCQPSTPASHFHLLRTHAYVNWHRPLVIMTPKSMLRNKLAVSQPEEFLTGRWQPAMDDPSISDPASVRRVLLCSGKIRWDLVRRRAELGLDKDVAIISLERLYPLPTKDLAQALSRYRHVSDVRYVQDEPQNQGAWEFLAWHLPSALADELPGYNLQMRPFTREPASAPAVGSHHVHEEQENILLTSAVSD